MSKLLDYTGLGHFLDKLKTLFVTDVGVNGNSLTYTKDGVTSDIASLKTVNYNSIIGSGNISTTLAYEIRGTMYKLASKGDSFINCLLFLYSETELICSATSYNLTDNKELTTLDFDPFGYIFRSGMNVTDGNLFASENLCSLGYYDMRYAFKITETPLIPNKDVYLKCQPLVDVLGKRTGRVKFVEGQPITQELPNTEDNYVYIFLGIAGSTVSIYLYLNHPIYEFKNGAIRLWTNQEEHLALTSEEIDRDIIEIVEFEDPVFKQWVLGNSSFGVSNNIIIPGEVLQSQLDAVTSYAGGSNNYSISKGDDLAKFTNMTNMGSNMFTALSLMTSVLLPSKLLAIGIASFSGCSSLLEIILPNTLSYIDYGAFRYCTSLQTITIPDNVYYLGSEAFNGCTNLKTAIIGNGVTSLRNYTFYMCTSLESIVIGNSVTSIGQNDLARCSSLTSVTFGNSLTSIGSDAFWDCTALKTIKFPDSLTSITSGAFSGCNLEVVDFGNTRNNIVPYVYFGLNTTIIVPDSLVDDWKATSGWSSIASLIVSYSEYYNN